MLRRPSEEYMSVRTIPYSRSRHNPASNAKSKRSTPPYAGQDGEVVSLRPSGERCLSLGCTWLPKEQTEALRSRSRGVGKSFSAGSHLRTRAFSGIGPCSLACVSHFEVILKWELASLYPRMLSKQFLAKESVTQTQQARDTKMPRNQRSRRAQYSSTSFFIVLLLRWSMRQ